MSDQTAEARRQAIDPLQRRYEEWEQDDMPPEVTDKLVRDLAAQLAAVQRENAALRKELFDRNRGAHAE